MSRAVFMSDFETTTDDNDCRVWLWGLSEIGSHRVIDGNSITSFCEEIAQYDSIIYFHNLKFDGVFILDHIMKQGYKHRQNKLYPKTFSTLIDKSGKYYSIKVCWKSGATTEFRDSLKKLPFSVEALARAWKMPISKGDLDYKKYREPGYVRTDEEKDYLDRDILIVAMALETQLSEGMAKLTVGSDSLTEYKRLVTPQVFKKNFPVLPNNIDADIRESYKGGYTYASPRYKLKMQGAGTVHDVNSLYPSVMYHELLPYGSPKFVIGLPKVSKQYPLFVVSVTFTAKLKENHVPIIQVKRSTMFSETEYQSEITEPTTLTFTSVDLEMIHKHYDVNIISYNNGYSFKGRYGLFKEYIEKWSKIKAESKGALREIAKLHLNSLYGKFASNPDVTGKVPVLEDNKIKLKLGEPEERAPIYTAMASFITAYARRVTLTAVQQNYERFAYCDTDSLHLMGVEAPQGIEVDDYKLGAWAHEATFDKSYYIRAKAYLEHLVIKDGKPVDYMSVVIAGAPKNITSKMTFEDIYDNHVFTGKLQPKTVPGGIVLTDTTFTLKL